MTTQTTRLPALDGLRAFSILLVVLSHAGLGRWVPGGLGVTIFFFISGFIITRLLIHEVEQTTQIAITAFYLRRFARLFPALLCYVCLSLLVLKFTGVNFDGLEVCAVFLYFVNYYGIYLGPLTEEFVSPFSITWSLAIEEHFYFSLPFDFLALDREYPTLRPDLNFLTRADIGLALLPGLWCWAGPIATLPTL